LFRTTTTKTGLAPICCRNIETHSMGRNSYFDF
jgi:hypothetical protein